MAWREYCAAHAAAAGAFWRDDADRVERPDTKTLHAADDRAQLRDCEVVTTTRTGLACQVILAIGLAKLGQTDDDRDITLLRSVLAGLKRLASPPLASA